MVSPFSIQVYRGALPPFTGKAVSVTRLPLHTGFDEGVTATLTAWFPLTVMVTGAEVAGFPAVQVRLESIVQVITSPSDGMYP